MRKYDYKEVEFLQAESGNVDVHGHEVLVKRIPFEERNGFIDPHELSIMKEHWVAREDKPKEGPPLLPKEALEFMRDSMGFPNLNLNTVEIYTQFETLNINNNIVGLWRYYPRKSVKRKNRPSLLYIHGGAWMGGTPYTVENACRLIAELADAVVFNIDYSLAPEKKFPNGFNDCFGALEHIYNSAEYYGIDKNKIAVGGDSAGGNLTAAVALKDRDLGTNMMALQVLIYPSVTMLTTGNPGMKFDIKEFDMSDEQKDIIDKIIIICRPKSENDDTIQMEGQYITNREAAYHPYVSPLLALTHKGLPKALCVSAEFDGLRVQTEHYAKLLSEAGVDVKTMRYKGVAHAFIDKLGFLPQAEDLCFEVAKALKEM